MAVIGLTRETISDAQLARAKPDPAHRDGICESDCGATLDIRTTSSSGGCGSGMRYGLAFGWWGLIAIAPQAIILASIWGVTGIPPTEARSLRSRGEAYRD